MDRDSLVEAGLGLISRFGSRALSLTQVASHAGVARATAYRMFGGRSALMNAIVDRELVLLREKFIAWGADEPDPARRVHIRVTSALGYIRDHGALQYVLRHEPEEVSRSLISVGVDDGPTLVERIVETVLPELTTEEAQALRPNPRGAIEFMVRTIMSSMVVPQSSLTDDAIADLVVRAVTD
ncbi:MAG: TetR family transcriptional regulator [Gordonia sp. (in: high G+C Gram-positive bacteria)]|uniref:TetR/AcrR family transcriptional regulator n=1 Tax=Gordonia sp. (in: high G+C Gram-positive bacteria) TaxID=84139 RepID=UPI0039E585D5